MSDIDPVVSELLVQFLDGLADMVDRVNDEAILDYVPMEYHPGNVSYMVLGDPEMRDHIPPGSHNRTQILGYTKPPVDSNCDYGIVLTPENAKKFALSLMACVVRAENAA